MTSACRVLYRSSAARRHRAAKTRGRYVFSVLAYAFVLIATIAVPAVRAELITLGIESASIVVTPGATVTVVGTITNQTGASLNSTDLALSFSGFVPLIVTTDQLLGSVAFVLPDDSGSGAVNLATITTAASATVGEVYSVDAVVQDAIGNVSNVVTVSLQVAFADALSAHPFFAWIEAVAQAGITGGCGGSPPRYCPDDGVTRGQMAVFLLRGVHGAAYQPPAATGGAFTDVPTSHPFASWIEELAREGITGGCSANPPAYCPAGTVTRGQMAVFLLRSKHGAGYQPQPATGLFADVALDHPFGRWIEQLAREGVTGGCLTSPLRYCPESPVTRGQMAVFLTRTFKLPL